MAGDTDTKECPSPYRDSHVATFSPRKKLKCAIKHLVFGDFGGISGKICQFKGYFNVVF